MSKNLTMRLEDSQMERLQRMAQRLGRTPDETGALLVEEGLREAEFEQIEFRDSPVGRQAYLRGSSLAVWEVILVARSYQMDEQRTADHLRWPLSRVEAAVSYAAAFPEEIGRSLQEHDALDFEALARLLPHAQRFIASEESDPSLGAPEHERQA